MERRLWFCVVWGMTRELFQSICMFLQMNRIDSRVALGHRRTLPAAKAHNVFHRHALVHQAGGVGVAELVRVDMMGADLLGG